MCFDKGYSTKRRALVGGGSIDIREVSGLLLDHHTVRVLSSLSAFEESQKTAKKLARPLRVISNLILMLLMVID